MGFSVFLVDDDGRYSPFCLKKNVVHPGRCLETIGEVKKAVLFIMALLRHLLAIAILPFTVVVLVPFLLAQRYGVTPAFGRPIGFLLVQVSGCGLLGVGFVLFVASVWRFVTEGQGTLAPWDPPRVFVARGPYQFVRNPMISGVILCLFGEALVLLSLPHTLWAVSFLVLNLLYIPLVEEPQLKRRFGESYEEYCRHVRRFIPRLRPWR
jgi:protein-S-isoprenylcysteine O-methyltransferase Ste14